MAGISIPISGDTAGLTAAVTEVRAAMSELASAIRAAMAPAKQAGNEVSLSMRNASTGAANASGSLKGFAGAASNAGMMIANVAAGAKGIRSAFRFVSGLGPAWKKVAVAAAGVGAAIIGVIGAIRVVKAAFSSLLGVASGVWRGIKSGASSAAGAVKGVFSGIGSAIPGGGMLGPLAGIAGIAGGVALVTTQLKGAFEAASAFEDLEVRVSSFLGSTEAAADLLKELSTFADKTPFSGRSIQEAASTLLGAGIRENVAGITKDLGAVARSGEQLEELADALAKGFAKGKFQTEELNKFLERGINLMPALRKETGLTGDELTKAIEKGLGFSTVSAAIASMSREGGEFFGILERRSKTTMGLISTLGDVWNSIRRAFAQPILDAIKPLLTDAIGMVESFRSTAVSAGKAVSNAILAGLALIKSGRTMELLEKGFSVVMWGAADVLMRGLRGAVAFLATALPPIFDLATSKLRDTRLWEGIRLQFQALGLTLMGAIYEATGATQKAKAAGMGAQILSTMGGAAIAAAGSNVDVGKTLKDSMFEGAKAAKNELLAPASDKFQAAKDSLKSLFDSVKTEIEAIRKASAIPPPTPGATGQGTGKTIAPDQGGTTKEPMVLTTSMARVGGGGFGMTFLPMVSEAKKSNVLLYKIEQNTRGTTRPAIA